MNSPVCNSKKKMDKMKIINDDIYEDGAMEAYVKSKVK